MHYIFYLYPCIGLLLAVRLARLRYAFIAHCIVILFFSVMLLRSGALRLHSPLSMSSLYLVNDESLPSFVTTQSTFFKRARLIRRLEELNPNYTVLQVDGFNELLVPESYRHVINDYAQYRTLTMILTSPTTEDLIRTMQSQGITHIFTAPGDRRKNRQDYRAKHTYSKLIDDRLQELFSRLKIEIQDENGIIYRIEKI